MTHNAYDSKTDQNADPELKAIKEPISPAQDADSTEELEVTASDDVKVVETELRNGKLYITVEGPSFHALQNIKTRTLAYDVRFEHGMGQAGIEVVGVPWPCDANGEPLTPSKERATRYRAQFRLTPG